MRYKLPLQHLSSPRAPQEIDVSSLIRNIYLDSEIGVATDLVAAGTTLENPYVYDAAARELKGLADQGLVRITAELSLIHI